jgi:hypothetical protein
MKWFGVLALSLLASTAQARTYQFIDDGALVTLSEARAERLQNMLYGVNDLFPCPWGPLVLWTFPEPTAPVWTPPEAPTPLAVIEPPGLIPNPPWPSTPPSAPAVPEMATWLMVAIGLAGIAAAKRARG